MQNARSFTFSRLLEVKNLTLDSSALAKNGIKTIPSQVEVGGKRDFCNFRWLVQKPKV